MSGHRRGDHYVDEEIITDSWMVGQSFREVCDGRCVLLHVVSTTKDCRIKVHRMREQAMANVSPPQDLLTTIYRQSWHPVASTSKRKPSSASNNHIHAIAGSLRRCASPFQQPATQCKRTGAPTNSKLRCFASAPEESHTRINCSTAEFLPRPMQCSTEPMFNLKRKDSMEHLTNTYSQSLRSAVEMGGFSKPACELSQQESTLVNSPLSVWRRRLKTCLSSSRAGTPSSPSATPTETKENTSPGVRARHSNSHLLARQHSWSNVTTTKGHRMVSQLNHTLATICLEGKTPPVQVRPDSARGTTRSRCSSTSSCLRSDIASRLGRSDTPMEASERAVRSDFPFRFVGCESSNFNRNRQEGELCGTGIASPDAKANSNAVDMQTSSSESPDSLLSNEAPHHPFDDNCFTEDSTCFIGDEKLRVDEVRPGESHADDAQSVFDELEQSDLSENELSTDDDEDLPFRDDEQQTLNRCKKLYEMENSPRSCEQESAGITGAQSNVTRALFIDTDASAPFAEDDLDSTGAEETQPYEFAAFFPPSLNQYNLRELASLPHDIDWRSVVQIAKIFPLPRHRTFDRKCTSVPCKMRRRGTSGENRVTFEMMIDRLLVMEKLQATTIQREALRHYHSAHHRMNYAKNKCVSKTRGVTEDRKDATEAVSPPASGRASGQRRRHSTSRMSMRMVWATETSKGEESLLKRACEDGDLTILHSNWLACCKRSCRPPASARRLSDGGKSPGDISAQIERRCKRFRPTSSLLSTYVYAWSERTKDERNRFNSSSIHSSLPSSCSSCREWMRKQRRDGSSTQQHSTRPVSARPPSRTTSRPSLTEKHTQPTQQQPIMPVKQPSTVPAAVVSPSLWTPCKPISSNLHLAKVALKQMNRGYPDFSQCIRLNKPQGTGGFTSTSAQSLAAAVKISPLLQSG